eukprot:30745_1
MAKKKLPFNKIYLFVALIWSMLFIVLYSGYNVPIQQTEYLGMDNKFKASLKTEDILIDKLLFTSHNCKGGHRSELGNIPSDNGKTLMCHFHNICYSKTQKQFIYFEKTDDNKVLINQNNEENIFSFEWKMTLWVFELITNSLYIF